MFLLYETIIALLIIILILYSCKSSFKSREGATFTNLDNNKIQSPLSDSNRSIMLLEASTGIQKHEIALNIVDPNYTLNNTVVDSEQDKITNIKNLLNIMKLEDVEIQKLLPNYIPSSDLEGLLDGKLLSSLGEQLDIAKITPTKSKLDIDPDSMNALAKNFYDASDDKEGTMTATMLSGQGDSYSSNAIKTKYNNSLVNNKIYNPNQLSNNAAQSILESNYLSYMINIIQYQEIAIDTIINNVSKNVVNVYTKKDI
jgi:hypothetical protein